MSSEHLVGITIGCLCRCKRGKLGVVTSIHREKVTGIGLDGKFWQTEYPEWMAACIQDYLKKTWNVSHSNGDL